MKKIFVFILALVFISCSEDPVENNYSETEQKLIGSWEVIKYEESLDGINWSDDPNNYCVIDDVWEFTENNVMNYYDGAVLCNNSSGTQIEKGTWKLTANETKIIFTYDGHPGEYESTIESLTETELVLVNAVGDIYGTISKKTFRIVD